MITLDIPAGLVQEASTVRNKSNWRDAHLVRWDGDTIMPVKGWDILGLGPFASTVRTIHKWMTNDGRIYVAYLCEEHCYVDVGNELLDITPVGGLVPPPINAGGYGDDLYNYLMFGTVRPGMSRLGNFTPAFTAANWGDELRVMTSSDGRYLKWSPATPATLLGVVPGSPIGRQFIITPERFVIMFGIEGKFDKFGWCDQENDQDWDFMDVTNKAGFYDIEPSSPITAACQFFGGILMFTMQGTYIIRFVGQPYIYSYTEVAKAPAPLNAQSVIDGPDGVMWPSVDGFWLHDGNSCRTIPCAVWDRIRTNIDFPNSMFYAAAVNVSCKDELWWFYVDKGANNKRKTTHVVIYEYRRGWWSYGRISRSAGTCYGNELTPIMSDGERIIIHESGYRYTGTDMPWVESFSMNIADGEFLGTLHQMRPEIIGDSEAIQWRLIKRMGRTDKDLETMSPPRQPFAGGGGLIDFRETARDIRLRIEMVKEEPWSVGPMLIDAKVRGKK